MKISTNCSGRRGKEQKYDGARPVQTNTLDRGREGSWEVGRAGLQTLEIQQADCFAPASVFCNDSLMVSPEVPLG